MTLDEMKLAITADKALDEAFDASTYAGQESVRDGWKAWEYLRRQLSSRGIPEDHVLAMQSMYMDKSRRMGTYAAVHAAVFGEPGVATIIF